MPEPQTFDAKYTMLCQQLGDAFTRVERLAKYIESLKSEISKLVFEANEAEPSTSDELKNG